MKKRINVIALMASFIMVFSSLAGCGLKLDFNELALKAGTVGVDYSDRITAEGVDSEDIKYALAEGYNLAAYGLSLGEDGAVTGNPTQKGTVEFEFEVSGAEGARKKVKEGKYSASINIGEGQLVFPDSVISLPVGQALSQRSLAEFVSGQGRGNAVTYSISEADKAKLDGVGVSLSANGAISGTSTAEEGVEIEISVTVESKDVKSAVGKVTVKFVLPGLVLSGSTLPADRVGAAYAVLLTRATIAGGADSGKLQLKYTPADNAAEDTLSSMGLTLTQDGVLFSDALLKPAGVNFSSGRPTSIPFNVSVAADGYIPAVATFTMALNAAPASLTGTAVTYNPNDALKTLPVANRLSPYSVSSTAAQAAQRPIKTATIPGGNRAIRYFVANDSADQLPAGFTLYQSGMLHAAGLVSNSLTVKEYKLKIEARAEGISEAPSAEFTLKVEPAFLIFPALNLEDQFIERDSAVNISASGAMLPDNGEAVGGAGNTAITYALATGSDFPGNMLPEGMSISEGGELQGSPTKAYGRFSFTVTASAEGYASQSGDVFIYVQDKMVTAVNGVFEAEYADDFSLRFGSGYSGAAAGPLMIQSSSGFTGAENHGFFVGWHYANGEDSTGGNPPFEFKFQSSAAVPSASITVRLASEVSNILPINPTTYQVEVNGVKITDYSANIAAADKAFRDVQIGNMPLVNGENVIRIRVLPNALGFHGGAAAPAFDCLKVGNTGGAVLTWRPHSYTLRAASQTFWLENAPNIV